MLLTCKHPDRDCPKLMCGHPLPCPYHTVQIDLTQNPPTINIPITAEMAWKGRARLAEIAETLNEDET